ncbi:hypothetical protein N0V85_004544 [Neurospora sp. IMI 360204]|nr:hypothetical protein N0V85_004544 [Neurospora sp. IMI 360204]
MASLAVYDSSRPVTDDAPTITPANASDAASCSTKKDHSTLPANSSAGISSGVPDGFSKTDPSTVPTPSSPKAENSTSTPASNMCEAENNIANNGQATPTEVAHNHDHVTSPSEAPSTAMQTTEPIPVIYPPRRPNIFRTREKHLQYPMRSRGPVAPDAVDTTKNGELSDEDNPDLQEFQAEREEMIQQKSEIFVRTMVRQVASQRRVEDLGDVWEI